MYLDIFTNKWILGGIALIIIVSSGCYFWYQHSLAADRKAAAETAEFGRQWKAAQKADTNNKTEINRDVVGDTEAEIQVQQNETPAENAEVAEVRVSPHGFGPYPTLPVDWPQDFWDTPKSIDHELHARIWIKLLEEGKHVQGMTTLGELVYPIIKGVRYVKWEEGPTPPYGEIRRYVGTNTGHPDDDLPEDRYGFTFESDMPSSIQVISYEDGGIDPYIYLNLKEK